jgi:hypothetical protein
MNMTPVMAILILDEKRRPTCLGCSAILAEQGMVEVVEEFPLNGHQPDFSVIVYKIAPGFTLDECRAAIKGRHVGPAWGG